MLQVRVGSLEADLDYLEVRLQKLGEVICEAYPTATAAILAGMGEIPVRSGLKNVSDAFNDWRRRLDFQVHLAQCN
jgi:hypothetical protein